MKTKLLFTIALFISFYGFTQTNGWYQYDRALEITSITPDDTNANELHLGTSLGYIKYNTMTNLVTDFLNLTSQDPAIVKVKDIAVNPTNSTIAFTMPGAIVIYDGTTATKHTYLNSNLTLGTSASTFSFLQVEYGKNGELYIFKEDVSGYQIYDNGIFETEVVTTFRPQDIVENNDGTKVYFAGWNNGLWELVKSTSTLTNFTPSNSSLITTSLHSIHVDANDLLYIGGFQGLNTMTPTGVWNTYQQLIPPANIFFYPVYDISVNSSGSVLINTSRPSSQDGKGFCVVDLTTNNWTSYTNDATNCLNENYFDDATYDSNDNIYVSHIVDLASTDIGELVLFNPTTDTCTPMDINYLNAEVLSTFNVSDINARKKLSGTYDIGFTKFGDLHQFNIDPTTFAGVFPSVITITPSAGQPAYSLLSDNDFFIVENNNGWVFVDDANNTIEFSHNIPNYLAIITQKAAAFASDNGIINLVHKGFDVAFNYRVYKTKCNTATATCTTPEEIFTTNRDLTQNISYGCTTNADVVTCFGVKILPTAGGEASRFGGGLAIQDQLWFFPSNSTATTTFDNPINLSVTKDPMVLRDSSTGLPDPGLIEGFSINVRTSNPSTGSPVLTPISIDIDNDGTNDEIIGQTKLILNEVQVNHFVEALTFFRSRITPADDGTGNFYPLAIKIQNINSKGVPNIVTTQIPDATIDNKLPNDLYISSAKFIQYTPTEALMILLTNYGLLIKTAIDISNLLLSTDDVSLKDTGLLLYPNPANDVVTFSGDSIKTIEVYDINGRKVLSMINSNSFSVKTLTQGVYIVKGTSDNNVIVTKKLIVD